MLAPQDEQEVRTVIEALRRLDPLLDIIWNPRAYIERPGTFDVTGRNGAPHYAARWQVIRRDRAASLHEERDYTIICTVTECDRSGRYPVMKERGPYAPLGEWLVEYMSVWDAAQRTLLDALEHQWAEHEKIDALTHDRDAHQEAAERVYRRFGGQYWMGRGFDPVARPAGGSSDPSSPPANTTSSTTTATEGRAQTAAALGASTP